jgi:DNA-binding CsgD family transcriptional regulator
MLGNVYEWCVDTWGDYADDAVEHPVSATGSFRVLRGGCWNSPALHVRAAFRNADSATYRGDDQGFRLARGQGPGPGAEPRTRSGPENHVPGRGPSQAPKLRSPKELVEPGRAVTLDATLTALLSPRERHVVELMLSGSSRKEIAARLDVSDETVKTYLTRAYRMLRVSGRAGLLKLTDGGRQS